MDSPLLTHLDQDGQVHMVEVGDKAVTLRVAEAQAFVRMLPETLACLQSGNTPKGDVSAVCRLAGIMAAKRTAELIPLCHPLALTGVEIDFLPQPPVLVELRSRVKCLGRTGVEMEALTAVSVAALTLYDMLKAIDKGMEVESIRLLSKEGGRSGTWNRSASTEIQASPAIVKGNT